MKTMKKILSAVFFISVIMVFGSCDGEDGLMGPAGPEGLAGLVGPAGADGSVLYSGTDDPLSVTGQNGDYYLNTTSGELFGPKTTGEWTDSFILNGEDGADGVNNINGADGVAGADGADGVTGADGADGVTGADGADGADGTDGVDGVDGADGVAGVAGVDGNTILSGTETPGEATGLDGDFYLDTDDILLYGPKVNDAWGAGLELKGADGNANVKSYVLTISKDDWVYELFEYSETFTKKVPFPTLTSAMHNDGAVLIYKTTNSITKIGTSTTYSILPVTDIIEMGESRSLKCDITKTVITTPLPSTSYSLDFMYQFSPIMEIGVTEDLTVKIVLIEGEHAELAKKFQDQGLAKMASEIGFTL
jgi:collagen triple helix repeat protein